jgi:chromosome segregation ATPase
MAVPWLTLLKAVPWRDVVKAAPAVREGAERLWDEIRKKSPDSKHSGENLSASSLNPVEQILAEHEASIVRLDAEIEQSAKVIKTLAEQNASLIVRIEKLQKRISIALGMAAVIALVVLFYVFGGA